MGCNPFQTDCAGPPVIADICSRAADLSQLVLDTSIDTIAPMLCPGSDCDDVLFAYISPHQPLPVYQNTVAVWLDSMSVALTPFDATGQRALIPGAIEPQIIVSAQLFLGPFDMGSMDDAGTYTYPDFQRLTDASLFAQKIAHTWWHALATTWAGAGGTAIGALTPVSDQGVFASWGISLTAIGA